MDLWKYDFEEIYDKREINFRNIAILLTHWIELEFRYKWEDYFIINWHDKSDWKSYWYFWKIGNEVNNFFCRICLFDESEKLVDFLANFRIDWQTLKEIFDEKIAPYEKEDKDNCIIAIL